MISRSEPASGAKIFSTLHLVRTKKSNGASRQDAKPQRNWRTALLGVFAVLSPTSIRFAKFFCRATNAKGAKGSNSPSFFAAFGRPRFVAAPRRYVFP